MNRTILVSAFAILATAAHAQSRPVSTDPGQMSAELTSRLFELDSKSVDSELAWCLAAKGAPSDPSLNVLSSQEIPGRKIAWYKNRTMQAFCEAAALSKPLVLVLGASNPAVYSNSDIMLRSVLPCPHITRFAGAAVFAWSSPERDEYAKQVRQTLSLNEVPTTVVIRYKKTNGKVSLQSVNRWEGLYDGAALGASLEQAIGRPASLASNNPSDWPGLACTAPALSLIRNSR